MKAKRVEEGGWEEEGVVQKLETTDKVNRGRCFSECEMKMGC